MAGPSVEFWQQRFASGTTPWERGETHPQLLRWLADGALATGERVLVPGCGSGVDLAALAMHGLRVTGIDYAPLAVERCRQELQRQGLQAEVVLADVLQWMPDAPADAVYEQTCLCALHPDDWLRYADRLHAWLPPGGRLFALWMQFQRAGAAEGRVEGPPYHCDINAMRALFPADRWEWPAPPYPALPHPIGATELAVVLTRSQGPRAS